jgi:hypothetical protein
MKKFYHGHGTSRLDTRLRAAIPGIPSGEWSFRGTGLDRLDPTGVVDFELAPRPLDDDDTETETVLDKPPGVPAPEAMGVADADKCDRCFQGCNASRIRPYHDRVRAMRSSSSRLRSKAVRWRA